jgi:hypothetical protein
MNATRVFLLSCLLWTVFAINISFKPEPGVKVVENASGEKKLVEPVQETRRNELFLDWKQCYGEPTSEFMTPHYAQLKLVGTPYNTPGVAISVQATLANNFTIEPNQVFYKFELWHEQTGSRIKYKGPFDVCCGGFVLPNYIDQNIVTHNADIYDYQSNKTTVECTDEGTTCPSNEGIFEMYMMRPLHKEEFGRYEASLIVYRNKEVVAPHKTWTEAEELLCIDIGFSYHKNNADWSLRGAEKEEEKPLNVPAKLM